MNPNKNYYETLGVDKNASEADIKQAYRTASKEHHPDKGGDEEKFKEVSEAYSILGEAAKKAVYDTQSPYGNAYQPHSGPRFEDFFEGFGFNGFPSAGFQQDFHQMFEEIDIRVSKQVSLADIYNDRKVTIDFTRRVPCSHCDGMGVEESADSVECLHCEGKGHADNGYRKVACSYCNTTGTIHTKECSKCSGTKLSDRRENISIDNVFVLKEEQTVAYGGMGHFSKYNRGRRGNLVITLLPEVQNRYQRENANLILDLKVDFMTAILGGEFEHEHLDGKTYKVTIPARSEQGDKFKLSGKGMLRPDKRSRGDLIFRVVLHIDYEKHSAAQLAQLTETFSAPEKK